jgi:GntR family transcriptional regulator
MLCFVTEEKSMTMTCAREEIVDKISNINRKSAMNIKIQRNTSVSLHQQLVTQISMQIAAGVISSATKLPSIRALSNKLGIHHNTCLTAYRELEQLGLIEIKPGSGARVTAMERDQRVQISQAKDLETLAEFFVREVQQRGHSWEEALKALEKVHQQHSNSSEKLVFVDQHSDILPVFKAELETALKRPILAIGPEEVTADPNIHFIVNRYHLQALKTRLKELKLSEKSYNKRITLIDVHSGHQELDLIRQVPEGSLVGVVSVSSIILRQAEAVIQAVCGDRVLVRTILYSKREEAEIANLAQRSKLLFADVLCSEKIQAFSKKRIQTIHTIQESEIKRLANALSE